MFTDGFAAGRLDPERWIDHYLPQWTTPERSRARYDLDADGLLLRIDADQPPWRDEDGPMRVSNLQTATFAGPLGSAIGTHRHTSELRVRTEVPTRRLWTPSGGRVEAVLEASPHPDCMLALWLVGLEDSGPDDSGEITVAELFGSLRGERRSTVRTGVKAIDDPRLTTDVVDVDLPIDTAEPHTYAVEWSEAGVALFVDGALVHTVRQALPYPLQLMLDLFEFPEAVPRDPAAYPRTARARSVCGTP
ncbi:family 16 glycosylhydrolase [Rathayibacter sp. VKM Ac-2759]|uniref:glycoside hydrolase family 16 protein n=1 Tax=Rathayibacter sp. VKM Ac-2759 TaxID=2609252 RepID=UPI001315CAC3|nr:glycoside hydrolase family 16 protein [Rathayibacter sp. VKM Ac-2759]QHC65136.1 family 16 glycosylhydrolase [Rathayibacter sp. VKM Ac-2759]